MELLVFGNAGLPVLVFPSCRGRFFEFEDCGMVNAAASRIEHGHIQLFCVDSIDAESWYNQEASPRDRIARHLQYEQYILHEVVPFICKGDNARNLNTAGAGFGGFHAFNIALRHPDIFSGVLTLGGTFDPSCQLSGYYDNDCYFNIPSHYLPNLADHWYLDRYRRNTYVLATAVHDPCWNENERMAQLLRSKGISCRLDVWGDCSGHDWPSWQRMLQSYV